MKLKCQAAPIVKCDTEGGGEGRDARGGGCGELEVLSIVPLPPGVCRLLARVISFVGSDPAREALPVVKRGWRVEGVGQLGPPLGIVLERVKADTSSELQCPVWA